MIELGKKLSLAFHRRYNGKTRPVLWESNPGANKYGLLWSGYSDNYIRVTAAESVDVFNSVTPTRLHKAQADGVEGTIIWPSL